MLAASCYDFGGRGGGSLSGRCRLLFQVLDEIGVDMSSKLAAAPKQRVAAGSRVQQQQQAEDEEDGLVARLAALK